MSLTYDCAYHLHCNLALASGRDVILDRLHQQMTYSGLLEGVPNSRSNDWHIEAALKDAQTLCVDGARPHLVSPVRRDFLRVPGDMASGGSPRHVPEWLPLVTCVARFRDSTPARDPSKHGSALTVVWFQDEFAPPILEPVLSSLVNLDWNSLAHDFEW